MNRHKALSIVYPAVENIISGSKTVEIRSWLPPHLPFLNLLLVENENYLNDGEIDKHGLAKAIVDVIHCEAWTYDMFLQQSENVRLGRSWKPGYYIWHLNNIRKIEAPVLCEARKGIYDVF